MKKIVIPILIVMLFVLFAGCGNNTEAETTTTETTTEKAPGKYADSEYLGTWYNADADETFICKLKDDGTARFKDDKKAKWEETQTGITITATVDGEKVTMDGYFVIAGDGYASH